MCGCTDVITLIFVLTKKPYTVCHDKLVFFSLTIKLIITYSKLEFQLGVLNLRTPDKKGWREEEGLREVAFRHFFFRKQTLPVTVASVA